MDVSTQFGAKALGEIEQIMRRATAARQNVPPQSSAAHHEPTTQPLNPSIKQPPPAPAALSASSTVTSHAVDNAQGFPPRPLGRINCLTLFLERSQPSSGPQTPA